MAPRGSLLVALAACITQADIDARLDRDADGFDRGEDCDDDNADVHPAAEERCDNGIDEDCDPSTSCRWQGELTLEDIDARVVTTHGSIAGLAVVDGASHTAASVILLDGTGRLWRLASDDASASAVALTAMVDPPVRQLVTGDVDGDDLTDLILDYDDDFAGVEVRWGRSDATFSTEADLRIVMRAAAPDAPSRVAARPSIGAQPGEVYIIDPGEDSPALLGWTVARQHMELTRDDASQREPLPHAFWSPQAVCSPNSDVCHLLLHAPTHAAVWHGTLAPADPPLSASDTSFRAGFTPWHMRPASIMPDLDADGTPDWLWLVRPESAPSVGRVVSIAGQAAQGDIDLLLAPALATLPVGAPVHAVGTADADGDGVDDLLWLGADTERLVLHARFGPLDPLEPTVAPHASIHLPASSGASDLHLTAMRSRIRAADDIVIAWADGQSRVAIIPGRGR